MRNEFQRHKKSDGVKWAITGIVLFLIIALLAGAIAAIVTETNPADWGEMIEQEFKQPADDVDNDVDNGDVIDDVAEKATIAE